MDPKRFASFWLRLLAWMIDRAILCMPATAVVLALCIQETVVNGYPLEEQLPLVPQGVSALSWLLGIPYGVLLESSKWQATVGKMAVGIIVTDVSGQRLTFWRAAGRQVCKMFSGICCAVGYWIAAFTERRQALHDLMASTLVLNRRE